MNKNIKCMLKTAANNQNIHDLSSNIINAVDTTKVLIKTKEIKKRKPLFALGGIVSALSAGAIAVCLVAIVMNQNEDIKVDNVDHSVYAKEYATDIYRLAQIAMNTSTLSLNKASGKLLSNEEEVIIVNEVNPYIKSIDAFLNDEPVKFDLYVSTLENYGAFLDIKYGADDMEFYYNETLEREKNIGKENYKSYSSIEGLIIYNDSISYKVTGTKRIRNGKTESSLTILLNDNDNITLEEIMGKDKTEYRFDEFINCKHNLKTIVNKYDEVRFQSTYKLDFEKNQENLVASFADGFKDERLYVEMDEANIKYTFGNSKNVYNK